MQQQPLEDAAAHGHLPQGLKQRGGQDIVWLTDPVYPGCFDRQLCHSLIRSFPQNVTPQFEILNIKQDWFGYYCHVKLRLAKGRILQKIGE